MPESVLNEGLKEAYIEANQQNWTKLEWDNYLRAFIKERDDIGRLELAVKNGKIEEKKEVAKNLANNGVSIKIIIKTTGLTENDIEKL